MRVLWWTLLLTAAGLFLYRNLFVPIWGRRRFRIQSVVAETHNTFTLSLVSDRTRPLEHQPGQFMFLKLLRPGRTSEEHPFTISSSPTREGPLTVTVKQSGDFTNTIHETLPGDEARVEAPYGRFSFVYREAKSFLFIAAGVGVTPIMSMLRALEDTADRRPAMLIYANRTEEDVLFREELSQGSAGVRVVHVLSRPGADWKGLRGHLTAEIIRNSAGELLKDADVFLCGPPALMDAILRMLRSLGVPAKRIHYERFAL
jgi:predicted ferric reductase